MNGDDFDSREETTETLDDKQISKKHKKKVKLSITFILSIIIFWMLWFLKGYTSITYNDNIYDVLPITLILLFCFIAVIGLIVFIQVIKEIIKKNIKSIITITFLFGITFHLWMIFSFGDFGNSVYSSSTFTNINSKYTVGDQYYFTINELKPNNSITLECNKETHESIMKDECIYYSMEYRKWNFIKNKGYLKYIDTTDYVDNRNKNKFN